jgi:hypothetical protein
MRSSLASQRASKFNRCRSILHLSSAFKRVPARNPIVFAARRSNGPWRIRFMVSSSKLATSAVLRPRTTSLRLSFAPFLALVFRAFSGLSLIGVPSDVVGNLYCLAKAYY